MKKSNSSQYDEFKAVFKELNSNIRKFRYHLENGNFSPSEKRLLTAVYAYKKNEKELLFKLLKTSELSSPFFEATRRYLLGLAHNHFGNYKFAVEHLSKSANLFSELSEWEFYVFAQVPLALAFGNQRNLIEMEKCICALESHRSISLFCDLLIYQAKALYLMLSDQSEECVSFIDSIWESHVIKRDVFIPSFHLLQFSCFFKLNQYPLCRSVLEKYKKSTGLVIKVNYKYMKTLLDHIEKGSPIYTYKKDFEENSELLAQLEVIKGLSVGNVDEARKFWQELYQHNPALYGEDFSYHGDYCLFSVALNKHRKNSQRTAFNLNEIDQKSTNLEKLLFILEGSQAPIAKEDLARYIWKEEYSEDLDRKLRKLIASCRAKYLLEIKNTKGFYALVQNPLKISAS